MAHTAVGGPGGEEQGAVVTATTCDGGLVPPAVSPRTRTCQLPDWYTGSDKGRLRAPGHRQEHRVAGRRGFDHVTWEGTGPGAALHDSSTRSSTAIATRCSGGFGTAFDPKLRVMRADGWLRPAPLAATTSTSYSFGGSGGEVHERRCAGSVSRSASGLPAIAPRTTNDVIPAPIAGVNDKATRSSLAVA